MHASKADGIYKLCFVCTDNSIFLSHLCWIVGKQDDLLSSGGIWEDLYRDAKKRTAVDFLDENLVLETANKLRLNYVDGLIDKSALRKEVLCQVSLHLYMGYHFQAICFPTRWNI